MAGADLARRRLLVQRVAGAPFAGPREAVASLCAVQAQDYRGALWAVGLRTRHASEADVERAIADRSIVRTWPMRGTLHLVAAADVRWMMELLAPRAVAANAARERQLGLDRAAFARSRALLGRALRGGRRLTRDALYAVLREGGVSPAGQRGIHVLWRLAHERLLCPAARDGKQQTFALFEEWVPRGRALSREEGLAELAARYFGGHGPATIQDLAWWSGLAAGDVREALALARPGLAREVVDGRELWRSASARARRGAGDAAHLLPAFDELLVGYRDRSAILAPAHADRVHHLLSPTIVAGDRVVGTWTRSPRGDAVVVKATFFGRPGRARREALAAAAERYGAFLGRPVALA
jgi:hypothetical protein